MVLYKVINTIYDNNARAHLPDADELGVKSLFLSLVHYYNVMSA